MLQVLTCFQRSPRNKVINSCIIKHGKSFHTYSTLQLVYYLQSNDREEGERGGREGRERGEGRERERGRERGGREREEIKREGRRREGE